MPSVRCSSRSSSDSPSFSLLFSFGPKIYHVLDARIPFHLFLILLCMITHSAGSTGQSKLKSGKYTLWLQHSLFLFLPLLSMPLFVSASRGAYYNSLSPSFDIGPSFSSRPLPPFPSFPPALRHQLSFPLTYSFPFFSYHLPWSGCPFLKVPYF